MSEKWKKRRKGKQKVWVYLNWEKKIKEFKEMSEKFVVES